MSDCSCEDCVPQGTCYDCNDKAETIEALRMENRELQTKITAFRHQLEVYVNQVDNPFVDDRVRNVAKTILSKSNKHFEEQK